MKRKRYPGVKPFERNEKDIFFGRKQDINDLYEVILLEKLTVLFGKSGYGKSSLLNAGILPRFEEEKGKDSSKYYIPLQFRFGTYKDEVTSISPLMHVQQRLAEKLEIIEANNYLEDLTELPTLWYHFKKRQTESQDRFILVFDQFEEFFTYPLEQQQAFKHQLAELLYLTVPQKVRDASEDLPDQQYNLLVKRLDVKAVFAIRSDRLSFLDQLKDALPYILHKRYELRSLNRNQAKEAILEPAGLGENENLSFASPPFIYSPEALELVLDILSADKLKGQEGIEAFQLQILCEYLESEIIAGRISNNQIEPVHFVDKTHDIYEGYYQRLLDKLPLDISNTAQLLIEESLIFSDPETGESRRLSVDADVLVQRYSNEGITHKALSQLENTFLLRREPNSVGGFNYEVSHDSLVTPITNAKNKRLKAEKTSLKKKNWSVLSRMVFSIAIFFILLSLLFNSPDYGIYGGSEIRRIELKTREYDYQSVDQITEETYRFVQLKYDPSSIVCSESVKIVLLEKSEYLRIEVRTKGEIIMDQNNLMCKLFRTNECNCKKIELIYLSFSFREIPTGVQVIMEINAKYGSGFFSGVRRRGFLDIGEDYPSYFLPYANSLKEQYKRYLRNN